MSTVTMNISLTEDLKTFVDARVKARSYSSHSEYVRDLVRRDEERAKDERLKALIGQGLDSPLLPESFDVGKHLRSRASASRIKTRKSAQR